jgi:predicted outer membrane lipoprotein
MPSDGLAREIAVGHIRLLHPLWILPMLLFACFGAFTLLWNEVENDRHQGWQAFLSQPLPDDVVSDLCLRNLVPSNVGNCQNSSIQIPLSSIPAIFQANIPDGATKDEVNRLFGRYLIDCQSEAETPASLRCQYKLASYTVTIHYRSASDTLISMDFLQP